jgi:hypothetical protein
VQTNSGWNTFIRVTNFEDGPGEALVEISLYPAGGGAAEAVYTSVDIAAGETGTVNLLDHVPPGWVGSALLESQTDVGAIAERVKAETHMLIMNSAKSVDILTDTQMMAPLVLNNWNSWNTGISIVNLSGSENEILITYYDINGNPIDTDEFKLQPYAMDFVYTPASGDDSGYVGSATVQGSHAFFGAVDEVKYLGNDLDTGHAMSYMITSDLAEKDESLALPLVQRGVLATGMGDTTGIQLFNPTNDSVDVMVWLFTTNADVLGFPDDVTIGPKQGYTFYMFDAEGAYDNFAGSAVVHVISGDGGVVAVSNNVNYEVQYDGSASFNVVKTIWSPPAAVALDE